MIAYVIATRDRQGELACTLDRLSRLEAHAQGLAGEVVIVDNASATPVRAPNWLDNGLAVRVIRRHSNAGAAGRNDGVRATDAEWCVLLDDDSAPIDGGFVAALERTQGDVGAVSADIHLADGSRERGGLPEVFVGCGVAVRRWAFLAAGGYDAALGYYAEEYDLSAKLMQMGLRVAFEPSFRVEHRKASGGRDMGVILARLVRNNGWVLKRYCPADELDARLRENEARYRAIAEREGAVDGFERGLGELRTTIDAQLRTPMTGAQWARFTGLGAAREALWMAQTVGLLGPTATLIDPGKNAWVVERVLGELGVGVVERGGSPVVATMSPGPMLDAGRRTRGAVLPWLEAQRLCGGAPSATARAIAA